MGIATCSAPVLGPEGPVWRRSLSKPYLVCLHLLPVLELTVTSGAQEISQPPRRSISNPPECCEVQLNLGTETRRQMAAAASRFGISRGSVFIKSCRSAAQTGASHSKASWQLFNPKAQEFDIRQKKKKSIVSNFSAPHLAYSLGESKVKGQKGKPRSIRHWFCARSSRFRITSSYSERIQTRHNRATSPTVAQLPRVDSKQHPPTPSGCTAHCTGLIPPADPLALSCLEIHTERDTEQILCCLVSASHQPNTNPSECCQHPH